MLLLIAPTPFESALLREHLNVTRTHLLNDLQVLAGTLQGQQLLLAHSGVGQVNMAIQLTRLIAQFDPTRVILCGCAGCYPGSGLKIADLVLAEEEVCGDFGVHCADGFTSMADLNLPNEPRLAPALRHSFELDGGLLGWACSLLPEARSGRFVTVNSCSGTPPVSRQLEERTGGLCENMEGAAAAQICTDRQLPLLELRGISNPTGTRAPEQWNLTAGAEAAQRGVLTLLAHWPPTA